MSHREDRVRVGWGGGAILDLKGRRGNGGPSHEFMKPTLHVTKHVRSTRTLQFKGRKKNVERTRGQIKRHEIAHRKLVGIYGPGKRLMASGWLTFMDLAKR